MSLNIIQNGKHAGCVKGFIHTGEAWFAKSVLTDEEFDEVMFGFYAPEGGGTGEARMVWRTIGCQVVPELRVFDDGWEALTQFSDVLGLLGAIEPKVGERLTGRQFCDLLRKCGFLDMTERVRRERPWLKKG